MEKPTEKQVLEKLQSIVFYDITEIKDKQRWCYLFSKLNPDQTWTHEWVEDRFLVFPDDDAINIGLFFYTGFFKPRLKGGYLRMLMCRSLNDKQRGRIKKEIGWKQGEIVVSLPTKDGKHLTFKTLPLKKLKIEKAEDFTKETEDQIRNQLLCKIEQKAKEILSLVDECRTQW
jgi:hypothetical protein